MSLWFSGVLSIDGSSIIVLNYNALFYINVSARVLTAVFAMEYAAAYDKGGIFALTEAEPTKQE